MKPYGVLQFNSLPEGSACVRVCLYAYTYAGVSKCDLRAERVRRVQWGIKNRKVTV